MCKSNFIRFFLLAKLSLLLLTSCQKEEENTFDILVFSTLPDEALEEITELAKSELPTDLELDVHSTHQLVKD